MQSKARDVPTYLDGVKERDRDAEIAFASQANYISLYVLKTDGVRANRAALRGLSVEKGCTRFRSPKKSISRSSRSCSPIHVDPGTGSASAAPLMFVVGTSTRKEIAEIPTASWMRGLNSDSTDNLRRTA